MLIDSRLNTCLFNSDSLMLYAPISDTIGCLEKCLQLTKFASIIYSVISILLPFHKLTILKQGRYSNF